MLQFDVLRVIDLFRILENIKFSKILLPTSKNLQNLDSKTGLLSLILPSLSNKIKDNVIASNNLEETSIKALENALDKLDNECKILGLEFSLLAIKRGNDKFKKSKNLNLEEINSILVRIEDELKNHLFFQINSEDVAYYSCIPQWEKITTQFPKITYDIDEAGKCIASGRYTASMFHLMRVFELGIHEFAKSIEVKLNENQGWLKHLEKISSVVEALPDSSEAERKKKKELQQAKSHLHGIRLGWRNDTAHPKSTYTEEEAKNLYNLTKVFMHYLVQPLN